ncbi:MAG: CBS domain-containing protein [Acidimicrobiia bacterium]|jgi:CBS domain-containing protein|nr:CBS domain-containing protein [Acidimicrobiia bacterium]
MKVRDIMTTDPVKVTADTRLREAARLMVRHRVSGLPVVDEGGKLIGILSEGDFIRREAGRDRPHGVSLLDAVFGEGELQPVGAETVAEIMTRSVVTITPEASVGEAARVMGRRNVKRLPVVDLEGELIGIVSRADVVGAFTKPDDVIEDEVREDLIRRLLFLDPELVEVSVSDGVVTLEGELENRTEAHLLEELSRRIAGVVRVESRLRYKVDDRKLERGYPLP